MDSKLKWALGVVLGLAGAVGLFLLAGRWSDDRALETAIRDLSQSRVASARESLLKLAKKRPGDARVEHALGIAEQAFGSDEQALAAWHRVPTASAEFADTAVRASQLHIDRGEFAPAEELIVEALRNPGTRALDLRQILIQLFWHQGRLDEVRKLTEANFLAYSEEQGPTSSPALALLQSHLSIDIEPYPIDQFKIMLADYAAKAPDDDRVRLARANMATRSGELDLAAKLLDECLAKRPKDVAVWRARLDLGIAMGSLERVEQAIANLTSNDVPRSLAFEVAAWVFRQRKDPLSESRAWMNLLEQDKAHAVALERLAELELATGQTDKAVRLREQKAEVDRARLAYRARIQSDYKATAKEMLPLAERLGRMFEAFAFMSISMGIKPSQARNHPMYGRFYSVGADPVLGPGIPLAEFTGLSQSATRTEPRPVTSKEDRGQAPRFEEVAAASGLMFTYENGRSTLRQLPETMSGGLAVLDFDGDGWLDVYAVQGGVFPPDPKAPHAGDRLFRNKGNGTFEDVTEKARIPDLGKGYSIGVAVGDYDNDGRPDLFVTRWRAYALYRNKGDGTFEDVTTAVGLGGDRDWPTSAAFADLDNDGDLDLYVDHYLVWDSEQPRPCRDGKGLYSYCDPRLLPALGDHVFRNDSGKFVDVTKQSGIVDQDGRGLGVVATDLDDDGIVDVFVANDGTANYLFKGRGSLRFQEVGLVAGVAGNAEGGFQAGMGVGCGDLDGDGLPDLVVTNFYGESTSLFQNLGEGNFSDRTASSGLLTPTRTLLGFGVALADANNDGWLDLASTNGHVNDLRPIFPYAMPCQLLLGGRSGRFRDVSDTVGAGWKSPRVGRGLVAADLNNDGALDFLVLSQGEPLAYFRQVPGTSSAQFVTIQLEGTQSNRDAVGARIKLKAGGRTQTAWRFGGGSYQSAGDPRLHFGLGDATTLEELEIRWPSGTVEKHVGLKPGSIYRIKEGQAEPVVVGKPR